MMAQADLRRRAKQGDLRAIATLLNRAVQAKGMKASASFEDGYLQVLLEAIPAPDRVASVSLIRNVVLYLDIVGVRQVEIYARQTGTLKSVWSTSFSTGAQPLPPTEAQPVSRATPMKMPEGLPQGTSDRPQPKPLTQHSQPKQPFTLTIQDVQHWLAQLDPLKAGIMTLFAVYGWFGIGNYTVVGALEGNDPIMTFLHRVNLIFHEAGHTIFAMFGQFLHILGGSLMQILVPAVIAGYFFVTSQRFASAIVLCWVAQNFWDVSIYIKDAQERDLPLLGGEGVLHDWHFLLLDLHLLAQAQLVGAIVLSLGSLLYLVAILTGFYYARRNIDASKTT